MSQQKLYGYSFQEEAYAHLHLQLVSAYELKIDSNQSVDFNFL